MRFSFPSGKFVFFIHNSTHYLLINYMTQSAAGRFPHYVPATHPIFTGIAIGLERPDRGVVTGDRGADASAGRQKDK